VKKRAIADSQVQLGNVTAMAIETGSDGVGGLMKPEKELIEAGNTVLSGAQSAPTVALRPAIGPPAGPCCPSSPVAKLSG